MITIKNKQFTSANRKAGQLAKRYVDEVFASGWDGITRDKGLARCLQSYNRKGDKQLLWGKIKKEMNERMYSEFSISMTPEEKAFCEGYEYAQKEFANKLAEKKEQRGKVEQARRDHMAKKVWDLRKKVDLLEKDIKKKRNSSYKDGSRAAGEEDYEKRESADVLADKLIRTNRYRANRAGLDYINSNKNGNWFNTLTDNTLRSGEQGLYTGEDFAKGTDYYKTPTGDVSGYFNSYDMRNAVKPEPGYHGTTVQLSSLPNYNGISHEGYGFLGNSYSKYLNKKDKGGKVKVLSGNIPNHYRQYINEGNYRGQLL